METITEKPTKKPSTLAAKFALTCVGLFVLALIIGISSGGGPYKNEKMKLFPNTNYFAVRHAVTGVVTPLVSRSLSADWKDSILTIKNRTGAPNDYDATIRLANFSNGVGVAISSNYDDPKLADVVYNSWMESVSRSVSAQ